MYKLENLAGISRDVQVPLQQTEHVAEREKDATGAFG